MFYKMFYGRWSMGMLPAEKPFERMEENYIFAGQFRQMEGLRGFPGTNHL